MVWNGTIRRGERKTLEAVVVFSDLRGFTALSENSPEEDILDALDGYFELVVQSVEENGGDVLKFMGDGILSVFVIRDKNERNHMCRQAAFAARSVLERLAFLNQTRIGAGQPPLDLGIGINAGQVSYGNIGSPGRLDFTVLGSAVNTASRIEGLTKTVGNRVLVTAVVAGAAPDLFIERGRYKVRGLNDPIEIFGLIEQAGESR